MKSERILVLMGGNSEEREVSLRSGTAVLKALENIGYQAAGFDLGHEPITGILDFKPDLAFLALHGKNGEDGTVQGLLEIMGIPYTGPGVASSAICINKILTKKIVSYEGLPTAPFAIVKKKDLANEDISNTLLNNIGLPMVIKAATQGSSIGTYIVRNLADINSTLEAAFVYDHEVLVEKFIDGVELTASVIGNSSPQVLPLIEITSSNEFYDYESKYTPGMCSHIIPARISDDVRERVTNLSAMVYKSLDCRGFSRIDFIVDKQGNPYILEVNTIPGMTEMSLVPDAARAAGISFEELVEKVVRLGLEK